MALLRIGLIPQGALTLHEYAATETSECRPH